MAEQRGRVRVEPGQKRVRVYLGGELVADTTRPLLVWELPYYPAYYLPRADVRGGVLQATSTTSRSPSRGTAQHFTVKAGGKEAVDAAWTYPDSPIEDLRDAIRFDWNAMDSWFEEDEEVYVHPRDPHKRVDTLHSSRHVEVSVGGVVVADSAHPVLLFETGLPVRYYLPQVDVRMDLLEPTDKVTQCPYKGTARYWSLPGVPEGQDVAWSYPTPVAESIKVAGRVAFYNERADITVDGIPQERPQTPFS
ncbi:MAG TPA: DUF427 domain-containing protein [Acidimicrobiales bacterium]|jgi:uncharacterized protein (DUF427 family)|nr:DUF427 domain-containing protein [Acidimicrobiales bacterium]